MVANAGPATAIGATVGDTFPAAITGATWTAAGAGGAAGFTPAGTGAIADTVNLPAGATVTYTVVATIDPAAAGDLVNTATVSAGPTAAFDPDPADNSATDTDTLTPQVDVTVTKNDGTTIVAAGTSTTYTILVTNTGVGTATGVGVSDPLPVGVTSATWSGTNGSAGTGALTDTIASLAPGETVTYTMTDQVDPGATGTIVNTATVTAANDVNPGNNSASDTDTIGIPSWTLSTIVTYGGAGAPGTFDNITYTDGGAFSCMNHPEDGATPCSATYPGGTVVTVTFSNDLQMSWVCPDGSSDLDTTGPPFSGTCTVTMNANMQMSIQSDFQL